jgi:VWFA-related protein
VEIPVSVRDAHDRPVAGLTKADFAVYDSGKSQTIVSFSAVGASLSDSLRSEPRRRFVALVIDDLAVIPCALNAAPDLSYSFAAVAEMRTPAEELFKDSLRSGDQISLFDFWQGQVLSFQNDAAAFRGALNRLTIHTTCAGFNWKLRTLQDIEDYLAQLPGDRSILLASLHFRGSSLAVSRIVDRALKYGITINTLDAGGVGTQNDALRWLAEGTGGTYFHNSNDFTRGMKEIGTAPPGSYLLGIAANDVQDGRYHPLKVKTTAGLPFFVKARPGYYAEEAKSAAAPSPDAQLAQIVVGNEIRHDLPVTFSVAPPKPEDPPQMLTVVLKIDRAHFPFPKQNGRRQQMLTVVAALDDGSGNYVKGEKVGIVFDMCDTAYAAMVKRTEPLALDMPLGAPPGHYRLRTVLREDSTNRITATAQPIELKAPAGATR